MRRTGYSRLVPEKKATLCYRGGSLVGEGGVVLIVVLSLRGCGCTTRSYVQYLVVNQTKYLSCVTPTVFLLLCLDFTLNHVQLIPYRRQLER